MPKPMTPSERLVGRRLPPEPTYADQILAAFVKEDGSFCGRAEPSDSWLRPAFKKLQRAGYLRFSFAIGFGTGRGQSSRIFVLTEKGQQPAREALERATARRAARNQWSIDCTAAWRAAAKAKAAATQEEPAAEKASTPDSDGIGDPGF